MCALITGTNVFGVSYLYDSLNRLTNVDYGNGSVISYSYDAAGNRLTYSGAVANDTIAPSIAITNPTLALTFTNYQRDHQFERHCVGQHRRDPGNVGQYIGAASAPPAARQFWSITGVPLKTGANVISVTAYDAAGNSAHATLIVTLSAGTGTAPPNQITGCRLANGIYRFTLNGPLGSNYVIYASSDLKYWTPLCTNTIPSAGLMVFVDPSAGGYTKRFYRALPPGTAVTLLPPSSLPELTGIGVSASGMFEFNLNGSVGSNYVIQVSSDLVNWVNLVTNAIPDSGVSVLDFPIQATQPKEFYRALPAP